MSFEEPYVAAGDEFTVNTTYERSQYDSAVAQLANGNLIVVWYESTPGSSANRLLRGQVFAPDGSPVGGELTLATSGASPTVAALANGGFVVVHASGGLNAQMFDATGAATAPAFKIIQSTATAFGQAAPDIVGLAGGGFAVVWEDERTTGADADRLGVHLRAFDQNGAAVGGDVLVNGATFRSQFDSSITALAGGGYVVTWSDTGAGGYIKAQIFTAAGTRVGTEFVVSASGSVGSSVTTLANGNFAVAWYQGGSHHVQVYTPAGAPVGAEVSVAANLSGTQIGPELTALADGGYAIAWTTEGAAAPGDGSGRAVAVQVYHADGQAHGGPQLVNGQTGGDQHDPAILGLANGDFVITWSDVNGTGADDDEVKARIFTTTPQAPNEAPVIVSDGGGTSAALSVDEGATAVTTVVATDADGPEPVRYSITGGPDAALFAIDAVTGVLSFVDAPDYEAPAAANNFYTVVVTASDGDRSSWQSVQILVGNVNEGVTIISGAGADSVALSILENRTAVTLVQADDVDGDAVSYTIAGGADASLFVIDAQTGALSFAQSPDFEAPGDADADNVYEVTVRAGDGEFTDDQQLSVTVDGVGEGVTIISSATVSVDENGTAATLVAATDEDGDPVTYAIAGGADAASFAIDAATGALSFLAAPDFEAPGDADGDNVYQVDVTASDGEFVASQALTVAVADVNEGFGPGWANGARVAVENQNFVGFFTATDLDGDAVTYAITDGDDSALFIIDAGTGALSFIAAPDHENPASAAGTNSYRVFITASDGSIAEERFFNIIVANENEGVTIISNGGGATASVATLENGVSVTIVTAVDPDGTAPFYAIVGGADAARFGINSNGVLYFLAAPDHEAPGDVGADNVYDVVVSASDGSFSDTQAIAVAVGNVDEGVTITSHGGAGSVALSVAENGAAVTSVAANDADGGPVSYAIAGGADAARFTIDAQSGALSFVSAPNYEAPADAGGDNVYNVVVSASDGAFSDTQAFSVSVGNVDEPVEILSYGGAAAVALTVEEHSVSVGDLEARDEEDWPVTFSITGGADAALFRVDPYTGVLAFNYGIYPDFEAPADAGGDNVYDVVVTASSSTSSADQAFAITVTNRNEGPWITSDGGGDADLSINEGDRNVTTVVGYDPDGTTPTYSIVGGPDAALFTIDAVTGALTFIDAPDYEAPHNGTNLYTVEVAASDGEHIGRQTIRVEVNNVNEGVTITSGGGAAAIAVSVGENGTAVASITASDVDGDALAYSISGGADASRFAIDAQTGVLRFVQAPNFEFPSDAGGDNVYDVVVAVTDGAFTDSQALAVTVANLNESVAITSNGGGSGAAVAVAENGTAVTIVAASDPDGAAVTYAIAGGVDAARFTINASTGALTFVSAPNFEAPADAGGNNVYDVVVSASDGSFSDTQALAVSVGNVNEAVTITSNGGGASAAVAVAENGAAATIVAASDADGGAVSYAIAGGADAARFTINAATGTLAFVTAPNFEAPADAGANNVYEVIVSASDGALTDTQALAISVGNVNEAVAITSNGGGASAAVAAAENGTAVTIVAASDPDGGAVAYAIVGGADAARFTINAATGALAFVAAPNHEAPTDAGANNVYDVVVSASDGAFTDTQALAVTVTNVREGNTITGTSGNNTISTTTTVSGQPRATELEDTIYGLGGTDTISGAGGADIIDGGSGNDTINGGLGADVLIGGAGADRFVYNLTAESQAGAADVITDFSRSQSDKINLNAIDANSNANGNQNFQFIGAAAFSNVAGQLRFEQVNGKTFVSGDVNGDGIGDFQIQLENPVTLISSDFIL